MNATLHHGRAAGRAIGLVGILLGLGPFVVSPPPASQAQMPPTSWSVKEHPCKAGLHPQPGGPFAVLMFCEDALGNHLGVVHLKAIGSRSRPRAAAWTLDDRYWVQPTWGRDVTGFAWSDDQRLFISTNNVYGDGMLFELNLTNRTARRLLPVRLQAGQTGPGYTIRSIDNARGVLFLWPRGEVRFR